MLRRFVDSTARRIDGSISEVQQQTGVIFLSVLPAESLEPGTEDGFAGDCRWYLTAMLDEECLLVVQQTAPRRAGSTRH
jgi:hypothetical protein